MKLSAMKLGQVTTVKAGGFISQQLRWDPAAKTTMVKNRASTLMLADKYNKSDGHGAGHSLDKAGNLQVIYKHSEQYLIVKPLVDMFMGLIEDKLGRG
jgi:hypothetical protein